MVVHDAFGDALAADEDTVIQHALRFYGEMKYHEFEGFEFDHDMTPKLVRDLDGSLFMILPISRVSYGE